MVRAIDLARFRRFFVVYSQEDLGRWPQLWQAFGQSLLMKSVSSLACSANDTISKKMSCVPGPCPPVLAPPCVPGPCPLFWTGVRSTMSNVIDSTNGPHQCDPPRMDTRQCVSPRMGQQQYSPGQSVATGRSQRAALGSRPTTPKTP